MKKNIENTKEVIKTENVDNTIDNKSDETVDKNGNVKTKKKTDYKEKYEVFSNKLMEVGGKFGNQRHMASIRDAFATFMPIIILGALATLVNNVFITPDSLLANWCGAEAGNELYQSWADVSFYISPIFGGIWTASFAFFSVYLVFLLGYFLATSYEGANPLFGGMIALAAWLTFDPITVGSVVNGWSMYYLGTSGMLLAIIIGLTAPMLLNRLEKVDKLKIKMPNGVPPAVSRAFSSLIPIGITLFVFAMIQPVWGAFAYGVGFGKDETAAATMMVYQISYTWSLEGYSDVSGVLNVSIENNEYLFLAIEAGHWMDGSVIWTDTTVGPENDALIKYVEDLLSQPWDGVKMDLTLNIGSLAELQTLQEIDIPSVASTNEWYYLFSTVESAIAVPLMDIAGHPAMIFFIVLLMGILWFFGLHGTNILAPVIEPLWGAATISNTALFGEFGNEVLEHGWVGPSGEELSSWTKGAFDAFAMLGGAGATLALLVGIFVVSKSRIHKEVAKVSIAPGVFQINEPVIFGLPIILNPVYAIPWILIQPINAIIAFFVIDAGLVNPSVAILPWTTPVFISGVLSTLDWRSLILTAGLFTFSFLAYLPFILIDAKQQISREIDSTEKEDIEKYIKEVKAESKEKRSKKRKLRKQQLINAPSNISKAIINTPSYIATKAVNTKNTIVSIPSKVKNKFTKKPKTSDKPEDKTSTKPEVKTSTKPEVKKTTATKKPAAKKEEKTSK